VRRTSLPLVALIVLASAALAARADEPAAAPAPAAPPAKAEGSPLVVVLDPGHGGPFPHDGAHGAKGLVEKTIALQVAKRLREQLEAAGATVLLTREDDASDVSLADRARFANEANADLFVSIHCNSMATRQGRSVTRGVESYFLSPDPTDAEAKLLAELENGGPAAVPLPKTHDAVSGLLADLALGQARNDSAALAETLHRALVRRTGAPSRGLRQAPFLVLSGTRMPSALIEIGFISHPGEGRLLAKEAYQEKIAEALAQGIREFAAHVLLRRLLPPTEDARAALLAQRSEAARERSSHLAAPGSLAHKASPQDQAGSGPESAAANAAPAANAVPETAAAPAAAPPGEAPAPSDAAKLPPPPSPALPAPDPAGAKP